MLSQSIQSLSCIDRILKVANIVNFFGRFYYQKILEYKRTEKYYHINEPILVEDGKYII